MSIIIKGMKMPENCTECRFGYDGKCFAVKPFHRFFVDDPFECPLIELPPHGDLIDRDALMKDGWKLYKEVMRMGGYAIHEKPLDYQDIPTVIPADKGEET